MTRYGMTLFWILVLLNLGAVGFWLASMRLQVVLHRRWAHGVGEIADRLNVLLRRAAKRVLAMRPKRPVVVPSLDPLIDEVEREESLASAPQSGSEAWWRALADSGGILPQPAASGRKGATGTPPTG